MKLNPFAHGGLHSSTSVGDTGVTTVISSLDYEDVTLKAILQMGGHAENSSNDRQTVIVVNSRAFTKVLSHENVT